MDRDTARGRAYAYAANRITESTAKRPKVGERLVVRWPLQGGTLITGQTGPEVIENLAVKMQAEARNATRRQQRRNRSH